ncbi:M15 family metallopeptidase [Streptomyces griseoincarnatus]|uniref:M15 family metallopeptidase n=1 Tax=Promicromonospora sp. NPDC057138 TaxID=3346031 RepID=UPI003627E0D3
MTSASGARLVGGLLSGMLVLGCSATGPGAASTTDPQEHGVDAEAHVQADEDPPDIDRARMMQRVRVRADAELKMEHGVVDVQPAPEPVMAVPPSVPVENKGRDDVVLTVNYANGQIPAEALCSLWWSPGDLLRCDAAAALDDAVSAGMPVVPLTDSYRSLADQYAVKASLGALAAPPGTSVHGLGKAIDVPEPARSWLAGQGSAFGWVNPAWAQPGGAKPEPWHFEFVG